MDRESAYAFILDTLVQFHYRNCSRPDKSLGWTMAGSGKRMRISLHHDLFQRRAVYVLATARSTSNIPILGTTILNMGTKDLANISGEPDNRSVWASSALADALFTASQQKVLALLFGQPDREFFVTEIIELAGCGRGAVQRELVRLAESGLASVSKVGNRKYYRANPESPLFEEICGIVRRTIGVEASIQKALVPLVDRLVLAVLFGSVAQGTETATSDIDLLLVSDDLTLETVYRALSVAEELLGRRINPVLFTLDEFHLRHGDKSGFVPRVLEKPHSILVGNPDAA